MLIRRAVRDMIRRANICVNIVKNFSRRKTSINETFPSYLNLGIGGDKVDNVIFRMKNSGIPRKVQDVIILVGTNDLAANHFPDAVAKGIMNLAEVILQRVSVNGKIYVSTPKAGQV